LRVRRSAWALLALTACASPVELPATRTPVPSLEDRAQAAGWGSGTWMDQHTDCVAAAGMRPWKLVFLGDSITQSWGGPGRSVGAPAAGVWNEFFGDRDAVALGISGDRTQHLLWRWENGLAEALEPEHVVLLIGTNNVPHDSPEDIAAGIRDVIERLLAHPSQPTVLWSPPFRALDPNSGERLAVDRIAASLADLGGCERSVPIDLAGAFTLENGRLDERYVRGDGVHLTVEGYRRWAEMLAPHLGAPSGHTRN
jgi:lysophospholipase L1-like esterase